MITREFWTTKANHNRNLQVDVRALRAPSHQHSRLLRMPLVQEAM